MGERAGRPTLKTIAQMTGLAVPTVSRALSGASDIGAATRQRVQSIAQEIGYVPNRAGLRLRTGRSYVIALVMPTQVDMMNLTAQVIHAAASALRGTGYSLTVTPYFPDEDPTRAVRTIVQTQAADAIILNQIEPRDARVAYLMKEGFPFVTHGRSDWAAEHDFFDFDNASYARKAVQALAKRGRSRLWLIAPPTAQRYARDMIEAAQSTAQACGVQLDVLKGVHSDQPMHPLQSALEQRLAAAKGEGGVDGIIFGSSVACMAGVGAIEAARQTVGIDIDFFAKEAAPFLQILRPAILTQFEDANAAGTALAHAAIKRIEDPEAPLLQHLDVPQD